MRNGVAIAGCVLSAAVGVLMIVRHDAPVTEVGFNLACVWFLCGALVAKFWTREYWARLDKTIPQIWRKAKKNALPKYPPLARVMDFGGTILLLLSGVTLFMN